MNRPPFRQKSGRVIVLLAMLAMSVLACVVCRPLVTSIWYEMSCNGLGTAGDCLLIQALGIEYHAPRRSFLIKDLLVDESVFPRGWEAAGAPYDPEDGLLADRIVASFFIHGCPHSRRAGHYVYRFYGGARCADMGYRSESSNWFAPRDGWGPWGVPAELPHQSTVADQFRFSCRTRQGSTVQACHAVGQYEEYVVRFLVAMDPQGSDCMSFSDLERILSAIDERMASYLGRGTE